MTRWDVRRALKEAHPLTGSLPPSCKVHQDFRVYGLWFRVRVISLREVTGLCSRATAEAKKVSEGPSYVRTTSAPGQHRPIYLGTFTPRDSPAALRRSQLAGAHDVWQVRVLGDIGRRTRGFDNLKP